MKKLKIFFISLIFSTFLISTASANQCGEAYQRTLKKQRSYSPNTWQYNALKSYSSTLASLFMDSRKYPHALRTYEENCVNIYNNTVLRVR